MDRDEMVRETYAHFGLAIFRAQGLEHAIVNAMVVARMPDRARITRNDIDAFMDRHFKQTLGQLMRALNKFVTVPSDVTDVLDRALTRRNWLAHDYFRERAAEFMTNSGCLQMISELQAAQQLFADASGALDDLVRPIREQFGITDAAIASEVEAST